MKSTRPTTMPRAVKLKHADIRSQNWFIFRALIALLAPYTKLLKVRRNDAFQYELWTEHEYRVKSIYPQRRHGVLFAGIMVWKTHVGFYFYPLHLRDELRQRLPQELQVILNGQSALRFKNFDDPLPDQMKELLEKGFRYFDQQGWIFRRD